MFSQYSPQNRSRYLTFTGALLLQLALLGALLLIPRGNGLRFAGSRAGLRHAPYASLRVELVLPPVDDPRLREPAAAAEPQPPQPAPEPEPQPSEQAAADRPFSPLVQDDGGWMLDPVPETVMVMNHELHTAQPVYTPDPPLLHADLPASLRGQHIVVSLVINEDGAVAQATVLKGGELEILPQLMETLRNWTFTPARMNGVAVPSRRVIMLHLPS